MQALLRDLYNSLPKVVELDYVTIVLHDATRGEMRMHWLQTSDGRAPSVPNNALKIEESPAGMAWRRQEPVLIDDLTREKRWPLLISKLKENGVSSSCYLPLTTAQRKLGALGFGRLHLKPFEPREVEFMQHVSAQVAVAVDNVLNYEKALCFQQKLERERDRLNVLLEITNALVSSLEPKELFSGIVGGLRRVVAHDYASLAVLSPDGQVMQLYALDYPSGELFMKEGMDIPLGLSPARIAVETRKPLVANKAKLMEFDSPVSRRLVEEGFESAVSVPLMVRGKVLGTLNLSSFEKNAFRDEDVQFLTQVAAQIAIAVSNTFAFREIQVLRDKLSDEKLYLEEEIRTEYNFREMIGDNAAFRAVLQQVGTVAPTDASVLIIGETGTGKELIARAIHEMSPRAQRTFVKLNCAAIPTGLLESEMFGHERGAFTGAIQQKLGRFELAHEGTLFLDEVGDIPLELQPKLLRALQEHEFERLGGTKTLKVNVRLVAATHRNLQQMVADGTFRMDLFYRLNVFPVVLPPLRTRRDDIPLLVRHFVQKFARRMGRTIERIPSEIMEALMRYDWPGNVRELENLMERAVILSPSEVLRVPLGELRNAEQVEGRTSETPVQASLTMEAAERNHIVQVLRESKWQLSGDGGAAARLGMKRTTLQSRMKKLGIARPV
ncbi:sigma 54-interacting transcriptional regulator [uncultured Paludibaculum sp.]|uniref:sigma 54-interacting transcriptional regulator n=1 Tax=uncultured Paludibaculum sp. TaxID=1765020 RepID=UPI002AAB9A1E|nr:sigma 54-interacting transcriptional regulator [uncultured Paludibaculum sp.]